MIPTRACLSLLLPACLVAATEADWKPVYAAAAGVRRPDSFILVGSATAFGFKWFGDDPFCAAYGRDLILLHPDKEACAALVRIQKGDGWALFDPSGELIGQGRGLPAPAQVQELMRQYGWTPVQEALKAHLKAFPGDGQAWLERLTATAFVALRCKEEGTLSPALEKVLLADVAPCLRALGELPGFSEQWGDPGHRFFRASALALGRSGLAESPEIAEDLRRLAARMPDLIARDPEREALWLTWQLLPHEADEQPYAHVKFGMALEPVPGRPWPPALFGFWMRGWYRDEPATMARQGGQFLEDNLDPAMVRRLGPVHAARMLETWGGLHLEGLLLQNHVDEALDFIGSLRARSGSHWSRVSAALRGNLVPVEADQDSHYDPMPIPGLAPGQRLAIQKALAEPAAADPETPRAAPLQLALLGIFKPLEWARLQLSPALSLWDYSELSWSPLSAERARALVAGHGWKDAARWVLLRGDQLLATGPGIPPPDTLEVALRAQGPPRLEVLGQFIMTHPERLDARRERFELLRPRLPNPALERLFLDDCVALGAQVGNPPANADPLLWKPAAKRICSDLQDTLRHWPFNGAAWLAYVEWSGLDEQLPRAAALLSGQETWPRESLVRLPGPIPASASLPVLKALVAAGRAREADAWAQALWAGGLKKWLIRWARMPALPGNSRAEGGYDRYSADALAILEQWGRALDLLKIPARAKTVRQEVEDIQPGLAKAMGRPEA